MPPKVRARPRSAPPAPRPAAPDAIPAPGLRALPPPLEDGQEKVALKRFEKYAKQLEESTRQTSKAFAVFVAALQETSKALCDCVSAVPGTVPSAESPVDHAALTTVSLLLNRSRQTLDQASEFAVWQVQLTSLAEGARALSAASHAVRASQKAMQSSVRKARKQPASPSAPLSASHRKSLEALASAQEHMLTRRQTLARLVSTRLPEMLSRYASGVDKVSTTIARAFQLIDSRTHRSTQTEPPALKRSCGTQITPAANAQPGMLPRARADTVSSPSTGPAPARTAAAEPVPVLGNIGRAFESLFGLFVSGTSSAEAAPIPRACDLSSAAGATRARAATPPRPTRTQPVTLSGPVVQRGGGGGLGALHWRDWLNRSRAAVAKRTRRAPRGPPTAAVPGVPVFERRSLPVWTAAARPVTTTTAA